MNGYQLTKNIQAQPTKQGTSDTGTLSTQVVTGK